MLLHMPWNRNLGGSRVQLELAEEFESLGHFVEKFDYDDAFPKAKTSFRWTQLTRPSFSSKAKSFVQENSHRFDIIDAHQGNLPYSKRELGFKGLLVARSVGLYAFYEEFEKSAIIKWPLLSLKAQLRNWLWSQRRQREQPYFLQSLQACDLINVCNQDELVYVQQVLGFKEKAIAQPFGLSRQRQIEFAEAMQPANIRLANKLVVFIGTWGARKGSKDWAEIITQVRTQVPEARFLFLGTGFTAKAVLADLKLSSECDWIEVVPSFSNEALPQLLSQATIGAFPSYIEGFGFAVLEKLASGLPTVAYDVPGPREMLQHVDSSLLLLVGDTNVFSNRIINLLKSDVNSYSKISKKSLEVAKQFSWSKIAKNTIQTYFFRLESLN